MLRSSSRLTTQGMGYPRVGREHVWLHVSGGVDYMQVKPQAARQAITECARQQGILLPIQTAYAAAWACATAKTMTPDQTIVVLLGEAVDKDIWDIGRTMAVEL